MLIEADSVKKKFYELVEYSPWMNTNHISSTQHASFLRRMPCTGILHTNMYRTNTKKEEFM